MTWHGVFIFESRLGRDGVVPRHKTIHISFMNDFLIQPNPDDPRLTTRVTGIDQNGNETETSVTVERPVTLYLNGQEIVTLMTVGDYLDCLAVGYLINQNLYAAYK